MRCLLWGLAFFGSCALVLAGLLLAFVGFLDLKVESDAYRTDVGPRGEDCGQGMVHLDIETGERVYCSTVPLISEPTTNALYGFTEDQKDEVYDLARELGRDGLSEADEDRIQALIDRYKATVPPANRYRTANRWWFGIPQAWYGVTMAAAGAIGILILRRTTV